MNIINPNPPPPPGVKKKREFDIKTYSNINVYTPYYSIWINRIIIILSSISSMRLCNFYSPCNKNKIRRRILTKVKEKKKNHKYSHNEYPHI